MNVDEYVELIDNLTVISEELPASYRVLRGVDAEVSTHNWAEPTPLRVMRCVSEDEFNRLQNEVAELRCLVEELLAERVLPRGVQDVL